MKSRKMLIVIFSLIFSVTSLSFATGNDKQLLNQKKQERKEVRRQINEKNKEMKELSSEIFELDSKISGVEERLDNLQSQMKQLNINIKATKAQIEETETEIKENEKLLKERIRAMYKTSDMTYIQLLMESKSIPDLVSNAYNVQKIVNSDRNMLDALEGDRERLEEQKKRLLGEKDRMTKVQQQIQQEQAELDGHRSALAGAKQNLASDIELLKRRDVELAKDSSVLQQRIDAAARASGSRNTPYNGGAFLWPLPIKGTLTSGYGYRADPKSGHRSFHQGQDIAAPYGTAVYAVADGVVITSRYQNSYGNVVTIDHGGGIATVYAHNSSLLVSEGTRVTKGQVISKVGSTGYSTGNHLHFEVRINGKTVNPMTYYK